MSETAAVNNHFTSRGRAWFALLIVVLGFTALNPFLVFALDSTSGRRGPSNLVGFFIGPMALQPFLFGLWTALGSGSILIRLPVLAATTMSVVLSAAVAIDRIGPQSGDIAEPVASIGTLFIVIFSASALLGALLRWWSRQSVQHSLEGENAAAPQLRFSVRYLLGLMTLCAVLVAIASRIFADGLNIPWEYLNEILVVGLTSAGIGVTACLPTIFVPWTILSTLPREPLMGIGVLFWLVWSSVLIAVVATVLDERVGESLPIVIGMQIGAAFASAVAASVLHAAGYRLTFKKQAEEVST